MIAANHAIIGGLIAVAIPEPLVAIPLALTSHFVLDSLPHFGTKKLKNFFRVFYSDAALVTLFYLILFLTRPSHWVLIAICAFVAMSPDIMWAPNGIRTLKGIPRKKLNKIMRFHKNIQWGEREWGMFVEIPWLIIFSYVFFISER
jgi:hypothetical protein